MDLRGNLVVVQLESDEVICADTELNGCRNVTDTRRDDEFDFGKNIPM